ncbi:UMP-CMP kinase [Basidiobolus meristosporus CBS 931.73]|uniref:Uridylate kinase n=1 Tax=Basidiobolus meristosporus CBS 931.73 TaxID=1314790 RepID=A0A1Y1Z4Z6_9FUNG|nr:UMP-CMP kinase [Basidiobolus meristosporus CBS 931.73]|eukprot:ORY05319.1 UMP-CMP kinase [Basidiobolus meristosporus CBS 931.73]
MFRSVISRSLVNKSLLLRSGATQQASLRRAPRLACDIRNFSNSVVRNAKQPKKVAPAVEQKQGPSGAAIFAVATIVASAFFVVYGKQADPKGKELEAKKEEVSKEATKEEKSTETSSSSPAFDKEDVTVIFVLGGPGAGKGTQSARLVKDFGFVHLSAGDLLREEASRPGSEFHDLINNYIKEGKIVPHEVTIALLRNAMKASGSKRFLVDGFPRAMDQALEFEKSVCECKFVLYFECPTEEMEKRLLKRGESSGRTDDNIESIRKRFDTFKNTSFPVIEHYDNLGKVQKVSCMATPDQVYANTKNIFNKLFDENK